ncbi:MAG: glycosyltransferase family 4 protein [Vicinamibacterales bacterium]
MRHYSAPDADGVPMKLVQVNYAFTPVESPDVLLDTYHTLTGWSEAASCAGLSVSVVQAFSTNAVRRRGNVDYLFCDDGGSRRLSPTMVHAAVAACEPDVVHVNGLDAPIRAWRLRQRLPAHVAIVVQDHASVPPRPFSLKAPLRRRAMRAADAYLFTAPAQATPWVEGGFISAAQPVHSVLEASTEMRPVHRATARALSAVDGAPAILWVGRLDANKDPLTVLDGFEQALASLPGATLTMVFGDDALLPVVTARIAASTALGGRVRMAGRVPHAQLAAWYSAADVFVLGSRRESCGYALLEACACGAVPVVTDIPSFRTITGEAAIGALWRVGDAAALTSALVGVSRRDLERERQRTRAHFDRHLSWTVVGARARAIYETVVEARRRRGGR